MSGSTDPGQTTYYSLDVAAELVGVPRTRVRRWIRAGLVQPATLERGRPLLGEVELARCRRICRLTRDLGINLAGVEVVLRLIDEMAAMRGEN